MSLDPRIHSIIPFLAISLLACGGGTTTTEEPTGGGSASAGGETEPPPALRTTTPVPVPQPAITREELSRPVQQIWTSTEEIVANRPPDPPLVATDEAIEAWSRDPFLPWVESRRTAIQAIEPLVDQIGDDIERAVAGGLFGYIYEDTAAGIRGAPIPEAIAMDSELLAIYAETLDEALRPFAQRALESYAYCATTFARLEQEAWYGWGAYCLERGREVADVFRLGEAAPAEAEATAPREPAAPTGPFHTVEVQFLEGTDEARKLRVMFHSNDETFGDATPPVRVHIVPDGDEARALDTRAAYDREAADMYLTPLVRVARLRRYERLDITLSARGPDGNVEARFTATIGATPPAPSTNFDAVASDSAQLPTPEPE
jgi:hypothetical protein